MKLTAFKHFGEKAEICIRSFSEQDTFAVAGKLAELLRSGDVLALRGQLGAGKTIFSKGLAKAIGVTSDVTSPTFTFVAEYTGAKFELYHFDLYRIDMPEQLEDIGFDGYVFGKGISLIEWPEKAGRYLPQDRLDITIERISGDTQGRQISMLGETQRYKSLLEEFEKIVDSCD